MANQRSHDNSFERPITAPLANAEDKKFEAASNVDRDAEGRVVNGPYVDPGAYKEPDDAVKKVRIPEEKAEDSDSLFVAADTTADGTFIQPGIVQPMAPAGGEPFDRPRDLTPEEERDYQHGN